VDVQPDSSNASDTITTLALERTCCIKPSFSASYDGLDGGRDKR
jgi:hypothetical protein